MFILINFLDKRKKPDVVIREYVLDKLELFAYHQVEGIRGVALIILV